MCESTNLHPDSVTRTCLACRQNLVSSGTGLDLSTQHRAIKCGLSIALGVCEVSARVNSRGELRPCCVVVQHFSASSYKAVSDNIGAFPIASPRLACAYRYKAM